MATLPNLPTDMKIVDPETGIMTPAWQRFFVQLIAYLRGP